MSPSRLSFSRRFLDWTFRWAVPFARFPIGSFIANWRTRASRRTRAVVEQFPMVALLTIAILAVGMRAGLGESASYALFALFAVLLGWLGWLYYRQSQWIAVHQWLCLSVSVALLFCLYHGKLQRQADFRVAAWKQSVQDLGAHLSPNYWQPVALRATIDSAVRFRRASVWNNRSKGGNPDADQLSSQSTIGWQSTTVLQVYEVRMGATWKQTSMAVPVTIDDRIEDLLPGDRVEVYCQWRLPGEASNPGQGDMAQRYAQLGYAAQAKTENAGQFLRLKNTQLGRVDRFLAWTSIIALRSIERNVPFGQSTLAAALILGQRDMAAWRLQEELLATGSIHMLSISGMHIEMIATALLVMGILGAFPRLWRLLGICLIVWCYAALCGANPPVIRAAIMLTASFGARCLGWQYSSLNNLAFAGFVLMLIRPSVMFEIGTQLSFMAVAVLILSSEKRHSRISPLRQMIAAKGSVTTKGLAWLRQWAWDMLRTSFWVWFITAPLVWTGFHVISPIAIVLNLVLWIPMLIALVAGLGMIVAGWIPIVGSVLGILCGVPLWLVDYFVAWGEWIPFGHFWLPAPPMLWLYAFYAIGISATVLFGVRRRPQRRRMLGSLALWFGLGLLYHPSIEWLKWFQDQKTMTITVLDVGHGSHVWIETPDNQLWCYDAGRMGDHERSYRSMADALWAMNKSRIHSMILSHADSDHFNAMPGLLTRFSVQRFVTTKQVVQSSDPLLDGLRKRIHRERIPEVIWDQGTHESGKGWSVLALHPPDSPVGGQDNAASLCLLFEYAGRLVLLPGDLEPPGTQMLIGNLPLNVEWLLAPHHGSLHSQSDKIVKWCQPKTIVVSGSERTMSPRVVKAFEGENRELLLTARDHALRTIIHSDGRVENFRWSDGDWKLTKSQDR